MRHRAHLWPVPRHRWLQVGTHLSGRRRSRRARAAAVIRIRWAMSTREARASPGRRARPARSAQARRNRVGDGASDSEPSASFRARAAPADVAALIRLKRALAESEDTLHAVRAGVADWLREGFGPGAGFTAFVAEAGDAATVIGMATCSQRVVTGWNGSVLFLQDLFVEAAYRTAASPARCWPASRRSPATSAARSSNSRCAPTILRRRSFIAAALPAGAAMPDLRAGGPGARLSPIATTANGNSRSRVERELPSPR
jgi:hypothetical protein